MSDALMLFAEYTLLGFAISAETFPRLPGPFGHPLPSRGGAAFGPAAGEALAGASRRLVGLTLVAWGSGCVRGWAGTGLQHTDCNRAHGTRHLSVQANHMILAKLRCPTHPPLPPTLCTGTRTGRQGRFLQCFSKVCTSVPAAHV